MTNPARSSKAKEAAKAKGRIVSVPVVNNNKNKKNRKSAPSKSRKTKVSLPWIAVGVVVVLVTGLVLFAILGKSSSSNGNADSSQPAPSSVVNAVTTIPDSIYNQIGVTSTGVSVTPPTKVSGQKPLTSVSPSGKTLPAVYYYGAEYCPYCAAERWAVAASLSRFGAMSNLWITTSSSTDVFPSTSSLSFAKVSFNSPDLAFRGIERYGNVVQANGAYNTIMTPTKAENALLKKYDSTTYIPSGSNGSIPFMDIGNQFLISGSSFSPSVLQGLTHAQIANGLNDPSNPATQAIIASSNYISASICQTTGGKPGNVCDSPGVKAAAKVMGF